MKTRGFDAVRLIVLLGVLFSTLAAATFRTSPLVSMAALLWSVLLLSGLMALWWKWRGGDWQVRREAPPVATAGEEFVMRLEVVNGGRWPLPFFEVGARDHATGATMRALTPWLGSGQSVSWQTTMNFDKRGVYRLPALAAGPVDPLGLFPPAREAVAAEEIIVWPRPLHLSHFNLGGVQGDANNSLLMSAGDSGDFRGVRAWRAGENARRIHWKSTARSGQLHIVEWEEEAAGDVTIVFDNSAAFTSAPLASSELIDENWALETAVQIVASAAVHVLDNGRTLHLWYWASDHSTARAQPFLVQGHGPTARAAVLDALAAVQIAADTEADLPSLTRAASISGQNALIVASAGAQWQHIAAWPGDTLRIIAVAADENDPIAHTAVTIVRPNDSIERALESL
jgi:uncharacterized protein (DUF58 family)